MKKGIRKIGLGKVYRYKRGSTNRVALTLCFQGMTCQE